DPERSADPRYGRDGRGDRLDGECGHREIRIVDRRIADEGARGLLFAVPGPARAAREGGRSPPERAEIPARELPRLRPPPARDDAAAVPDDGDRHVEPHGGEVMLKMLQAAVHALPRIGDDEPADDRVGSLRIEDRGDDLQRWRLGPDGARA